MMLTLSINWIITCMQWSFFMYNAITDFPLYLRFIIVVPTAPKLNDRRPWLIREVKISRRQRERWRERQWNIVVVFDTFLYIHKEVNIFKTITWKLHDGTQWIKLLRKTMRHKNVTVFRSVHWVPLIYFKVLTELLSVFMEIISFKMNDSSLQFRRLLQRSQIGSLEEQKKW